MREFFLTFDVEDFISDNSIWILQRILEDLNRYNLRSLFFITGHIAEKLRKFPTVVDLFDDHMIGYHSSSHTVHPTIFEFTDVADYQMAYEISLQRETAHVDPLSGKINGRGGILALKSLFPRKGIKAFRAPGSCWSPPHLECLRDLGIEYDFSANLNAAPVDFKGITFYPFPTVFGADLFSLGFFKSLLKHKTNVMLEHPSLLVNRGDWDTIYFLSNPVRLTPPIVRSKEETNKLLWMFDLLLRRIKTTQKMNLVQVTPDLKKSNRKLTPTKETIDKCYYSTLRWSKGIFGYKPQFLHDHFDKFFEINRN